GHSSFTLPRIWAVICSAMHFSRHWLYVCRCMAFSLLSGSRGIERAIAVRDFNRYSLAASPPAPSGGPEASPGRGEGVTRVADGPYFRYDGGVAPTITRAPARRQGVP